MTASLAGKTVVITGSTRGIGWAMAQSCAAAGASVVVSSRTASAVDSAVEAIRRTGGSASGLACDVTREAELRALMAFTLEQFGRIDIWVNNAGISLGMRTHLDTTEPEMRHILETNLLSTMVASRLLVEHFLGAGGGVLINVSGRGGNGQPGAYTAAYAATKAGVTVFTKSLAEEHRRDPVSILVFMPGMVDTDFYGETMEVTPGLEPLVDNVRVVLEAIGTPIESVGPALVDAACTVPGVKSGTVHRAGGGVRAMLGGMKLLWARLSGKMRSL